MATLTSDQDAEILARWNTYADEANQIAPGQAHLVFHDQSDDDLEATGETMIEVRAMHSVTGNPCTFTIYANEVTL